MRPERRRVGRSVEGSLVRSTVGRAIVDSLNNQYREDNNRK